MSILDTLNKKPEVAPALTLGDKARLLIGELVKDLDAPNQAIISDLILLISTVSKSQDSSIDKTKVLQTAQILIKQLVKPIANPNQQIIDELLQLIVTTGPTMTTGPAQQPKPVVAPPVAPQTQIPPAPQVNAAPKIEPKPQSAPQTTPQQQVSQAAQPTTVPAQSSSGDDGLSKHMLNLIMTQTKEIVKITNQLNNKIKDVEEKTLNKMTSHEQTISELKIKLDAYDKNFEDIHKAMDKFIGLYEIITNQFNPFVQNNKPEEHHTEEMSPQDFHQEALAQVKEMKKQLIDQQAQMQAISPKPAQQTQNTDTIKPQKAESKEINEAEEELIEHLPTDVGDLIKMLKEAKDEEYNSFINGELNLLSTWSRVRLKDPATTQLLEKKPTKAEALKALMKAMLRQKISKQS